MTAAPRPVILLIDDDKAALRQIGNLLQRDFVVRAALSRERAIQMAGNAPAPAAVVLGLASDADAEHALQAALPGVPCLHPEKPVHAASLRGCLRQVCALPEPAGPYADRRALVAEDDPLLGQVLGAILQANGIDHVLATDGAEALALARQERFDWILLDMHMPVMDGLEAARQLRSLPQGAALCLIACTGADDTASRAACTAAGMNDFLTKPVQAELLMEKLGHWLTPVAGPQSVLDADKLAELGGNDPARREIYARTFLDQLPAQQVALDAAQATGDLAALANIAHRLKSNARWLGGLAFGAALAELESTARAGTMAGIAPCLAACRRASADFQTALRSHMVQAATGDES